MTGIEGPASEPGPARRITVDFGASSNTGRRRTSNEDSYLAGGALFLVADGMGGHDAGEVASSMVVSSFEELALRPSVGLDDVRQTISQATRRVLGLPATGKSAGTTLTGVAISEAGGLPYWLVLNIGDSRTYRLAGSSLEQISVDHSVVQEQVDRGELTSAEAAGSPGRNVVTRAIGAGSSGEADYWFVPAEAGDRMLVCSDGLTNELADARILEVLLEESSPQDAATRLVHEALLHGGRDNVTVLVVDATAVDGQGSELPTTSPQHAGSAGEHHDPDETIPREALASLRRTGEEK
ncbi:hypothetical protein AU252_20100 [Pseudarthrobacter sulfonivorans]|uniref:PPM-type phosphatase domain-containing protein n=1 Tax=Pseudarthrobacter sulfonivorans TaxID=121292 RepID=A0A0U3FHM5_9MICC|nr:protein phosphatase 2C domain-containing protein [Pseudarthrobacter sulfonivorans]ALV43177.1 hypothetical protein AU252_20100 [Pseudarthrobacter sulfonivorans]